MKNTKEIHPATYLLSKEVLAYAKENNIDINSDNIVFTTILFLRDNSTLSPSKIIEVANQIKKK